MSTSTRKRSRKAPCPAEGRLEGLLVDHLEGGTILSFCEHARIPIAADLKADRWWPTFLEHYTTRDGIDEDQAWRDLATWPPIASRIVELQLAQQRGTA
jgi:hypothetical protein